MRSGASFACKIAAVVPFRYKSHGSGSTVWPVVVVDSPLPLLVVVDRAGNARDNGDVRRRSEEERVSFFLARPDPCEKAEEACGRWPNGDASVAWDTVDVRDASRAVRRWRLP